MRTRLLAAAVERLLPTQLPPAIYFCQASRSPPELHAAVSQRWEAWREAASRPTCLCRLRRSRSCARMSRRPKIRPASTQTVSLDESVTAASPQCRCVQGKFECIACTRLSVTQGCPECHRRDGGLSSSELVSPIARDGHHGHLNTHPYLDHNYRTLLIQRRIHTKDTSA